MIGSDEASVAGNYDPYTIFAAEEIPGLIQIRTKS